MSFASYTAYSSKDLGSLVLSGAPSPRDKGESDISHVAALRDGTMSISPELGTECLKWNYHIKCRQLASLIAGSRSPAAPVFDICRVNHNQGIAPEPGATSRVSDWLLGKPRCLIPTWPEFSAPHHLSAEGL